MLGVRLLLQNLMGVFEGAMIAGVDAMMVSYARCGGVFYFLFFYFWKTCGCGFGQSRFVLGFGSSRGCAVQYSTVQCRGEKLKGKEKWNC